MRALPGLIALLAALACGVPAGSAAFAQTVLTSAGPEKVAVTVYRAPYRRDAPIDRNNPGGYALVTETRTVTIPAGRATIRFEGVAGGILAESAIITGLPEGVREKNLDADLLSAASLYAHNVGRPVTLRRTDATGVSHEEQAIIRSGPEGAAILETASGFEVANCGPFEDRLVYDHVPSGLSARPTLSVETEAAQAGTVTITLSYLAWGFDWQANYVAEVSADGSHADLVAWVTLASGDPTSFVNADTQLVAGKVQRSSNRTTNPWDGSKQLVFHCYLKPPRPRVREVREEVAAPMMVTALPPPPPPPAPPPMARVEVVAKRVQQEDLGDLKLYWAPEPTTVAAHSQKQIALLVQPQVPMTIVYVSQVSADAAGTPMLMLRAHNRKEEGLGLPLPAGPVAVFQPFSGHPVLIGESSIDDKAVGEDVEIRMASATQVSARLEKPTDRDRLLTVSNANPFPIRFEVKLRLKDGQKLTHASTRLGRKDGAALWQVQVPANATAQLSYRIKGMD